MLGVVHDEGVSRIALWQYPWLAVSLVPMAKGERRIGSEGLAAEREFMSRWKETAPPRWPRAHRGAPDSLPEFAGLSSPRLGNTLGSSAHPHAELHYDGSGLQLPGSSTSQPAPRVLALVVTLILRLTCSSRTRWNAHICSGLVSGTTCSRHRRGGECLLRAEKLLRQQTGPDHVLRPRRCVSPST